MMLTLADADPNSTNAVARDVASKNVQNMMLLLSVSEIDVCNLYRVT